MRVFIQRSNQSSVTIEGNLYNQIPKGMVLLVGFEVTDTEQDIDYMVKKIIGLRIFDDDKGIMNKNILETQGEILSISQFTLHADTKKGNRPSYIKAMKSEQARLLYDLFNQKLNSFLPVKTGVFGADMIVNIENNGPISILLDSKNK